MTQQRDSERVEEIRKRAEEASPGPWNSETIYWPLRYADKNYIGGLEDLPDDVLGPCKYDSDFIACAREDIPWLLTQLAARDEEVVRLEAEVEDEIQRRDRYHDAIQEAHVALGGDGEWRAYVGGNPEPPNSGHLHLDVPVMARALREEVARLTEALIQIEAAGHNDDCIFCGFKDRIVNAALRSQNGEG